MDQDQEMSDDWTTWITQDLDMFADEPPFVSPDGAAEPSDRAIVPFQAAGSAFPRGDVADHPGFHDNDMNTFLTAQYNIDYDSSNVTAPSEVSPSMQPAQVSTIPPCGLSYGPSANTESDAIALQTALRDFTQIDSTGSASSKDKPSFGALEFIQIAAPANPMQEALHHDLNSELESAVENPETASTSSELRWQDAYTSSMDSAGVNLATEPVVTTSDGLVSSLDTSPCPPALIPLSQRISKQSSRPNNPTTRALQDSFVRPYASLRPKASAAVMQLGFRPSNHSGEQSNVSQPSSSEMVMTPHTLLPRIGDKRKRSQTDQKGVPRRFLCTPPLEKKPRVAEANQRQPTTTKKVKSKKVCLRCQMYKEKVSIPTLKILQE
ncbi:MAG: hypothetical protein Q9195_005817 [Heterodermia aff. obscurata]